MATLTTTITYSEPAGSIATTFATPGPQGLPGPQGNPGVGVPVGGSSGQVLAKASGANYDTVWATVAAGAPVWGQIMGTLSDQTDLSSALAGKYSTSNPAGYITSSALSGFATQAWVTFQGYLTSSSLSGYATQSWVTSQLTGYATQSFVTGQGYITASLVASTYQPISAMSAYLTKADNLASLISPSAARTNLGLGSMATASTSDYAIASRGLPSSGGAGQVLTKVNGTDYNVTWSSIIPGDRYLTTSTTTLTIVNNGTITLTVGTGLSYSTQQDVTVAHDASNHMHGTVTSYNSTTGALVVSVNQHSGSGTYSAWTVNVGGAVPSTSVAWGSITGTLSAQSDLQSALNAKLDTTTAASTYYPLSNPSAYIGDAPSDGTIYGRQNGSWVTAGGGGSFNGGTITNPLVVQSGTTSNVTVDTAGVYAYDLTSGGSVGTTLDFAGFNNFSGDDYTNIAPGNLQVRSSGQNIQITSGTITFADSTYQTTAATTFTGGAITNYISLQSSSYVSIFDVGTVYAFDFVGGGYGQISMGSVSGGNANSGLYTQISDGGVRFPDGTTQTTAATGGGGFVPGSGDLDMGGYSVTNANFNSGAGTVTAQNVTMTSGGVLTFGDSTTQTTAAVPGVQAISYASTDSNGIVHLDNTLVGKLIYTVNAGVIDVSAVSNSSPYQVLVFDVLTNYQYPKIITGNYPYWPSWEVAVPEGIAWVRIVVFGGGQFYPIGMGCTITTVGYGTLVFAPDSSAPSGNVYLGTDDNGTDMYVSTYTATYADGGIGYYTSAYYQPYGVNISQGGPYTIGGNDGFWYSDGGGGWYFAP